MLSIARVTVPRAAVRASVAACTRMHCQVPCGIFDDPIRVELMKEDAATVRKAMVQISDLSTQGTPLALNQVRFARQLRACRP